MLDQHLNTASDGLEQLFEACATFGSKRVFVVTTVLLIFIII
jgi:hypothetical protein